MAGVDKKTRILFLCTGNSCRSQMAEGWARHLKEGEVEAYSAGTERHGLDPLAVTVMAEGGADIGGQRSKTIDELPEGPFDYVITLCGRADETCPVFPGGTKKIHVPFDDPPMLAKTSTTEKEALVHYRRVREEIRSFIEILPGMLLRS